MGKRLDGFYMTDFCVLGFLERRGVCMHALADASTLKPNSFSYLSWAKY